MNIYVFYTKEGDIKCMSADENELRDPDLSKAVFPLSEVEPFMLGRGFSKYRIKKVKSPTGEICSIERRIVKTVDYTRTLDNYLTEIEDVKSGKTIMTITNQKTDKVFIVEFSPSFKALYYDGTDEDKEVIDEILRSSTSTIYITKKHNPYHLLFAISFLPGELFRQNRLYFNYKGTIENASAFTKRIISGYGYREVS